MAGWLAGYIAADGSVSGSGTVVIDSVHLENLHVVQAVANRLGVGVASIASNPRVVQLPYDSPLNGTIQMMHRLTFAGYTFPSKLLLLEQHRENFSTRTDTRDRLRWTVKEIRRTGIVVDTYCAVVPDTHNFVLTDGIQVMNCNVYHRVAVGAPPGKGHGKGWEEDMEIKKDYTAEQRAELGKQGHAFRNSNGEWSYPIADEQDLRNAIQAFGRSKPEDRSKLKSYIERRARALGKGDLIPDSWDEKSIKYAEVLLYASSLVKWSREELLAFVNEQKD